LQKEANTTCKTKPKIKDRRPKAALQIFDNA
jgi:hypothetical protein